MEKNDEYRTAKTQEEEDRLEWFIHDLYEELDHIEKLTTNDEADATFVLLAWVRDSIAKIHDDYRRD